MSGVALGADIAMVLPLRSLRPLDLGAPEYAVHHRLPMAADDLDVAVARRREDGGRRPALVAVELAGEQPAQRNDIVLERGQLELEVLLGGETAAHSHHLKAGVTLGLDDGVAPVLRLRAGGTGAKQSSSCCYRGRCGPQHWTFRHPDPRVSLVF
jgi:hypothetical protein